MRIIQLSFDLPIRGCHLELNQRVEVLPLHQDAGKTGRVDMRHQLKTGVVYFVRLRGKTITAKSTELAAIK